MENSQAPVSLEGVGEEGGKRMHAVMLEGSIEVSIGEVSIQAFIFAVETTRDDFYLVRTDRSF